MQDDKKFLLSTSPLTRGAITFCIVVGVVTLVYAFVSEPLRAWGSFLLSLFFFFTVSLGGVAFGGMQDVLGARWGRPIKRLHESFGRFCQLLCCCLCCFLFALSLALRRPIRFTSG